ncbi:hypothetical protein SKAU_G00257750 [Synaphobranchus kaupii]|uniref:Uncharacterized protein n=1 Tax=Synaphobranchus kaupii TaxID=118154 RepID=A0A9Q1ISH9_SYNKA|nr:hypothetical protein SKAU_G00257750 [Synaphobranchus kaupii]
MLMQGSLTTLGIRRKPVGELSMTPREDVLKCPPLGQRGELDPWESCPQTGLLCEAMKNRDFIGCQETRAFHLAAVHHFARSEATLVSVVACRSPPEQARDSSTRKSRARDMRTWGVCVCMRGWC